MWLCADSHTGGMRFLIKRSLIVGATMLLVLFGVAACGSTNDDQVNSSPEPSYVEESGSPDQPPQSNASSQQNLSIGETATFAYGATVKVYSYTFPAPQPMDNNTWTTTPGTQFAAIDVVGCAGNAEPFAFSGSLFAMRMADNTRLTPVVSLAETTLLPGEDCARSTLGFEVPQGQTPSDVLFTTLTQETARWTLT